MKIKRYQFGGILYTPVFKQNSFPDASKKQETKDNEWLQKAIVDVLKEGGLQNDVDYFLNVANSVLNDTFSGGLSGGFSELISLISLANRVRENKSAHTEAIKRIQTENSGSDLAISQRGDIYVLSEDGIKAINPLDFYKNSSKYQPLTNYDLVNLRSNNKDFTFNSHVLNDLTNSIGMKTITEYLKSTIKSFGVNTFGQTNVTKQLEIQKGLDQIQNLSKSQLLLITDKPKFTDQGYGNTQELLSAVTYLYDTLNDNMKNVLRATCAAEGKDPSKIENVYSLIIQAVQEHTDHGIEIENEEDSNSKNGSGTGKGTPAELTREQMMNFNRVTSDSQVVINASDEHHAFKLNSKVMGPSLDRQGDGIGRAVLSEVLKRDRAFSTVDQSSISFGDKLLSLSDLDRVVYNGGQIERTNMIYDVNVYSTTGKIVPDLQATKRYSEFMDWWKKHPDTNKQLVLTKARTDYDLDVTFNNNGEMVFRNMNPFFVINGYASDKAIDLNTDSKWLVPMNSAEGSRIFDVYQRILNYGDENGKTKTSTEFSGGWFGIGNASSMYQSAIFMPIIDTNISTVTSAGEYVPKEVLTDIANRNTILQGQPRGTW